MFLVQIDEWLGCVMMLYMGNICKVTSIGQVEVWGVQCGIELL